jgi:transcriptional regulator with XRE-family HTH domain
MKRMKQIREALGLTQAQAASRAGFDATMWNRIEHAGVDPRVSTAGRIAQALGVTISELVGEAPNYIPLEGRFSEREVALASAYLEERRNVLRLLSAINSFAARAASLWEARGVSIDEIRTTLSQLEAMGEYYVLDLHHRHTEDPAVQAMVDTQVLDHTEEEKTRAFRRNIARMQAAAKPVLESEAAHKERVRFEAVERTLGAMAVKGMKILGR